MIQSVSIQISKSMDPESKLDDLLALHESEIVEFKKAESNFHFNEIGKYFSALCNEANLKNQDSAWLVFGVDDRRNVVGSNFRPIRTSIESLKREIAEKMTSRLTFMEVYEVERQSKRVVLFQIPPAPRGIPIAYEGHYYGRDGESLGPLNIEEVERIRAQSNLEDWSSVVVPQAGLEDLDSDAILLARLNFMAKFPDKTQEAESWDDMKFLNKAKLTIKGKVTRTALLLLGKEESEHYLSPTTASRTRIMLALDGSMSLSEMKV